MTNELICSTCGKRFRISDSPVPPFCSERCQMIDLGRWLGEEIAVPHVGGPEAGVPFTDEGQTASSTGDGNPSH
ncbi:MAG: DNA gyrase inhibitor YacG [Planctomycetota bacterium]